MFNYMDLMSIVEAAKIIKSVNILVVGDKVLGTDADFVYLKETSMPVNKEGRSLFFNTLVLNDYIKNCEGNFFIEDKGDELYLGNTGTPRKIPLWNNTIFRNFAMRISDMRLRTKSLEKEQDVFEQNIQDTDLFKELSAMKTGDGFRYIIKKDKYIIPFFNNMLPIVKADKVDLKIFYVNSAVFLTEFIVHKKKSQDVIVYILCRNES